VEQA
jgi:hypothetical protein